MPIDFSMKGCIAYKQMLVREGKLLVEFSHSFTAANLFELFIDCPFHHLLNGPMKELRSMTKKCVAYLKNTNWKLCLPTLIIQISCSVISQYRLLNNNAKDKSKSV